MQPIGTNQSQGPTPNVPLPNVPLPNVPVPQPPNLPAPRAAQQSWTEPVYAEGTQKRMERQSRYQAAGVPVWGVLLIIVGAIALFGTLDIGLGWIFGLALGTWFVYLGVRRMQEGESANWWLVGLGLLIGLGSISTGFVDRLVFPLVLVLVGLGIILEYTMSRQMQKQ